jgi:hypothetical protein
LKIKTIKLSLLRKVKNPYLPAGRLESPEGDFEEFIDFQ